MALADLYCLAGAPLLTTCLESPVYDDISLEVLLKELNMLLNFSGCGFKNFIAFFGEAPARNETDEFTAALACLAAFCLRFQGLLVAASNLARTLQGRLPRNSSNILKNYETKAKNEGLSPSDQRIGELLDTVARRIIFVSKKFVFDVFIDAMNDTDKDAEWDTQWMRRGKVNFTEVRKFSQEDVANSGGKANREPYSSRKEEKKASGLARHADPTDIASTSDEDGLSASDRIKKGVYACCSLQPPGPRSRKGVTVKSEPPNVVTPPSTCCLLDSCLVRGDEHLTDLQVAVDVEEESIRRESSVYISGIQEINDDKGDTKWNDLPRRIQRFDRIRKRVPTGHPKLMKDSSEEALGALVTEDAQESPPADVQLTQRSPVTSAGPSDDITPYDDRSAVSSSASGPAYGESHHHQRDPTASPLTDLLEFSAN